MKLFVAIIVVLIVALALFYLRTEQAGAPTINNSIMLITSPSFQNNEFIPQKFSCDGSTSLTTGGGDINPELDISGVPEGAKSLALIMHDPDAPVSGGFTHWLVWNINPKTTVIKQESTSSGAVEGRNGSGKTGYTGPCPPPGHGIHHYHFYLFALDSMINLDPGAATKETLESEINKHLLAKADLVGLYER